MHITSFFLRPYFVISGMGSGGLSTQLSQQVKTVYSHVMPLQGLIKKHNYYYLRLTQLYPADTRVYKTPVLYSWPTEIQLLEFVTRCGYNSGNNFVMFASKLRRGAFCAVGLGATAFFANTANQAETESKVKGL